MHWSCMVLAFFHFWMMNSYKLAMRGVFTCDLDKNRIDKTPTRFETTREMGERGNMTIS